MHTQYQSASSLLVAAEDATSLRDLSSLLQDLGLPVPLCCSKPQELPQLVTARSYTALLLDVDRLGPCPAALVAAVAAADPGLPLIAFGSCCDPESMVKALQAGARDYMTKPVNPSRLYSNLERALLDADPEPAHYPGRDPELLAFAGILTCSPRMHQVFSYCRCVAASREPVLITGETGTGKELVALALHRLSGCTGRFVPVNMAGLDDTSFSDTMFGHTRGAFTGATGTRPGLIEQAERGTLFLDEVGDLPPRAQVKLLRVFQERFYLPLGADSPRKTQAKFISATNRDLNALRSDGLYREDFFFRIRTHHIHLPALRERREDIPLLLGSFILQAARHFRKARPHITRETLARLCAYEFPGNIRELRGMVFDAVARAGSALGLEHFAEYLETPCQDAGRQPPAGNAMFADLLQGLDRLPSLKQTGTALVAEAMRRASGSRRAAAALLGITRQALEKRLRRQRDERTAAPPV